MGRERGEFPRLFGAFLEAKNRFEILELILGATLTMQDGSPHLVSLDCNGVARTVKLPPAPKPGDFFIITNTSAGAFALTIQDSAGVALNPALAIAQGKTAIVFYIDATYGWRNLTGA